MAREYIEKLDTLNDGREKLNRSIDRSYDAEEKAVESIQESENSKNRSQAAIDKAESVQDQFNQVVIEGDSSVEAAQARIDAHGESHQTLKNRIDSHQFVVSKTPPANTNFWFEDRGESGLEVSTGSGINIANAIVSDDEIDDRTKLWFDK